MSPSQSLPFAISLCDSPVVGSSRRTQPTGNESLE